MRELKLVRLFFLPQKKLFRENPTPLHRYLVYLFKPQQLAAFLNIVQPYTNPTLIIPVKA